MPYKDVAKSRFRGKRSPLASVAAVMASTVSETEPGGVLSTSPLTAISVAQYRAISAKPPGRKKYGNRLATKEGLVFDSKLEAQKWLELRALEAAGHVRDLQRQVRVDLNVNGDRICYLVLDFVYERRDDLNQWRRVYADAKGFVTPAASIKLKLFQALFGQEIELLRAPRRRRRKAASRAPRSPLP